MKEKFLDMLVGQRLDAVEDIVGEDEEYRTIREEQIRLQEKLETMGLTEEQKEIIEKLLNKANQSGAVYGKTAYKQGFKDGAEFICELKKN